MSSAWRNRLKQTWGNTTIMRRILWPLLLLIGLSNMLVIGLGAHRLDQELLDNAASVLRTETQVLGDRFLFAVDELRADAEFLAAVLPRDLGMTLSPQARSHADWLHIEDHFIALLRSKPRDAQVRLLDRYGMEVMRVHRTAPEEPVLSAALDQLQDKSSRPYVSQLRQLPQGQVYLSGIDLNREQGRIQEPPQPVIRAGVPLRDAQGGLQGMLLINRFLDHHFEGLFAARTVAEEFRIANAQGEYILHPEASQEFCYEFGGSCNVLDEVPAARALIAKRQDLLTQSLSDGRLAVVRALDYSPLAEGRLLIVALSNRDRATQLREVVMSRVTFAGLAVLLLSVLVATLLARFIARPIVDMREAIRREGLNVRPEHLPLRGHGEVPELARAFHDLVIQLRTQKTLLELEVGQRKAAQADLEVKNEELQRANKEVEQFAYIASHDLQEPVRTVRSFIDMLRQNCGDSLDMDGLQILEFIENSSLRMQDLIKGLLDYSRLGKHAAPSQVSLNGLLDDVEQDLNSRLAETQAQLQIDDLPDVMGHKTELRLLFQNLISNAIKFARPGVPPVVKVSAHAEDDQWVFAVEDNGIGIAKSQYDRVFLIFQRLHGRFDYEGTGIGLAHCKKIVELHGGRIWLESEEGKGSTFFFSLQRVADGSAASQTAGQSHAAEDSSHSAGG